ncbi:MAG: hypothetical protein IPK82_17040 [Polyangiaceae bacterium]|nr:hypothetical protein [Polyangiaceae bacterium]
MVNAGEQWILEIQAGLQLSPGGVLILVDKAAPEQLGKVVRSLIVDHPNLEVLVDVQELVTLPDNTVVVLQPTPSDAEWLNEHRPLFARKALKVVLWCDDPTSKALAQQAPDFYDWISQRQDCPPGVSEHAVWGLKKAVCARAPGVLFVRDNPSKEAFEKVFHAALPRRRLVWLEPDYTPYSTLVDQIRKARSAWVGCLSWTLDSAERFRWALAEARRRTRAVLVLPDGREDWFWSVTDDLYSLRDSVRLLSKAGAKHPGRVAAVSGLEWSTIIHLLELLIRNYDEADLLRLMLRSADPGAGLAERALSSGVLGPALQGWAMSPPVRRHVGKYGALHRKQPRPPSRRQDGWFVYDGPEWPLLRSHAHRIEFALRTRPRTAETWADIARLALNKQSYDAAQVWAARSLEMHESPETWRIHGIAVGELALFNWDHGVPAASGLVADALHALDEASPMVNALLDPKERFAVYTLQAALMARAGLFDDANNALAAALDLLDQSTHQTRDQLRLVKTLGGLGRWTIAEEIARKALETSHTDDERREAWILLGMAALHLGRPDEALMFSQDVLKNFSDTQLRTTNDEDRFNAEWLQVDALLALDRAADALEAADSAVYTSAYWLGVTSGNTAAGLRHVGSRLPLLARALSRAGRLQDAQFLLRKLLGLPWSDEGISPGADLKSQPVLQELMHRDRGLPMTEETRAEMTKELIRVLRAQGRYTEAESVVYAGERTV